MGTRRDGFDHVRDAKSKHVRSSMSGVAETTMSYAA